MNIKWFVYRLKDILSCQRELALVKYYSLMFLYVKCIMMMLVVYTYTYLLVYHSLVTTTTTCLHVYLSTCRHKLIHET